MKRTTVFSVIILLFCTMGLTACGQASTLTASSKGTPSPSGEQEMDYTKLVTTLRAAGATVVAAGTVSPHPVPLLNVEGNY